MSAFYPPLTANVLRSTPAIRIFILAAVGVLLLTLSAKIKVPFYPVPMTMQTFVVLVLGMAYGAKLGAVTAAAYLAVGALGLPVFAGTPEKGLGFAYMFGPTGGYLFGFFLAMVLCGWLAERLSLRNFKLAAGIMLAGNVAIYLPGLLWLGSIIGWDKPILKVGLAPFIYADIFKLALAVAILPVIVRIVACHNPKK